MQSFHFPMGATRAAALLLALAIIESALAQSPAVTVTPLYRTTTNAAGQKIVLPSGPVELVVSQYEIAPGAVLPMHRHPYQRYGYVQAGTLRVTNDETGETKIYHAGDVIVEMVDIWHSAATIGADPVRLLVFDQIPPDKSNTVLKGDE
jgi:quercetin dioxygenase-like cupin family protein